MASFENLADPEFVLVLPPARPVGSGHCDEDIGIAVYRRLTGGDPADAQIEDGFDRHVFASILATAATEGGPLTERAGLAQDDLAALIKARFPVAADGLAAWCRHVSLVAEEDDEIAMVRDLLLANRSTAGDAGRWLAAMIARRAMEPNHLWEDLGLRDRSELTRLLNRHFGPLAARNTKNMRWKRFFYRTLCEDDGIVMCSTPVCSRCGDFDLCFGDESGESRLAYRRRTLALKVASLSEGDVSSFELSPAVVLP
jgi:nitrogen fixation protein NifQ